MKSISVLNHFTSFETPAPRAPGGNPVSSGYLRILLFSATPLLSVLARGPTYYPFVLKSIHRSNLIQRQRGRPEAASTAAPHLEKPLVSPLAPYLMVSCQLSLLPLLISHLYLLLSSSSFLSPPYTLLSSVLSCSSSYVATSYAPQEVLPSFPPGVPGSPHPEESRIPDVTGRDVRLVTSRALPVCRLRAGHSKRKETHLPPEIEIHFSCKSVL